ncbi:MULTISPECIES: helix-turn-helix domain-containing protein [unclassified Streptomyces]|uniref:helix-turn-helix domain-containing protein n=1 Tax=unclassified Streptomyces TaxID=2593676 RepID=UPI0025551D69|nr:MULTISPECIES: XRE family transcriptional regulator [unclassified Streptomyces]WRZ66818.1 XRE family transcriptional regulator [Streptomyces sp. NBC_01257]
MPRWKALPDELDPQIREFAGQLRRLVDRSGLSIAAVADRTGYSKTSWERYLNGRLLAPRGAIVALAEVTGTNQSHLNTMWELAERAWSRAEMRHDMTMEAIRITQARAALGETGTPRGHGRSRPSGAVGTAGGAVADQAPGEGRTPSVPVQRGSLPRMPQQPQSHAGPDAAPGHGLPPAVAFAAGIGGHQPPPAPRDGGKGGAGGNRKPAVIAAAVVGVLLVVTGVVLLMNSGGDTKGDAAGPTPSPTPTTSAPRLPAGVKCSGADCVGQDPEDMGCGGEYARTLSSATVGGSVIEVRYSKTCAAAWARITKAAAGDTVEITAGTAAGQNGTVGAAAEAYTPMVAVKRTADVQACATLASGTQGCTAEQAG